MIDEAYIESIAEVRVLRQQTIRLHRADADHRIVRGGKHDRPLAVIADRRDEDDSGRRQKREQPVVKRIVHVRAPAHIHDDVDSGMIDFPLHDRVKVLDERVAHRQQQDFPSAELRTGRVANESCVRILIDDDELRIAARKRRRRARERHESRDVVRCVALLRDVRAVRDFPRVTSVGKVVKVLRECIGRVEHARRNVRVLIACIDVCESRCRPRRRGGIGVTFTDCALKIRARFAIARDRNRGVASMRALCKLLEIPRVIVGAEARADARPRQTFPS